MTNNKTIERQSAAKAVAEIFRGQGPLTDEEREQYKQLTEDVANFNKTGSFKELRSSGQDDETEQQPQKVEIEVSTDGRENPEKDTEEEDEE